MNYSEEVRQKYAPATRTRFLLLGCLLVAAAFDGLSGSGIDRVIVQMPAWQHVGPLAWAAFSRWADLGTNGLIFYPLEKIGGTVFSVLAAIIFLFSRQRLPRGGAFPIYGAALFAISSLLITTQAAPLMVSTAQTNDPVTLQHALNGFAFWEALRAAVQALAFCCLLWALVVISRLHPMDKESAR
jgi:hypothetical protein